MADGNTAKTLIEYIHAQRKASCPVCQLSEDILKQIVAARTREVRAKIVLEWLSKEHGIEITNERYMAHWRARHESLDG